MRDGCGVVCVRAARETEQRATMADYEHFKRTLHDIVLPFLHEKTMMHIEQWSSDQKMTIPTTSWTCEEYT